jgi:tetratricopeptide (TPR) repeat protein
VHGDADADTEALFVRAHQAIKDGQWSTAKEAFEALLEPEESGEALFGLGIALWWLGETEASLRHWARAYAAFRRRPDPVQAVLAAFYLSLAYRMSLGNHAASRGWLGRAASLVEEFDLGPMNGWVLVARAYLATDTGHPHAGETYAREARQIARDAGDADLDLCAMSELGAALVEIGRVEEGAALLDEAMAGALAGEVSELDAIVLISCRTITSCSRGGDFARATQWVRAADEFHNRYGSPHLYTTCRTHYGGILFATGEWEQAERELQSALTIGKAAEPALHAEALAKLAELRLAQGRTEEAVRFLAGYEDHPATAYVAGAIHLAQGEAAVACSILRRRLREVEEESLEGAALVELLTEAEIALGSVEDVATRAERLAELGSSVGSDLIVAQGERALGRALVESGALETAISHLERALAAFGRLGMPLDVGRTRLLLARALADGGRETAIAEARGALASFEELGHARCRCRRRLSALARCEGGSRRPEGGRRAHEARAGGAGAPERGPLQPRHRQAPVHQPQDGRASRRQRALQARARRTWRGRGLRGPQPRCGLSLCHERGGRSRVVRRRSSRAPSPARPWPPSFRGG